MEVAHGRTHVAVAEQTLDSMDVDTGFKQMGGETVTQDVDAAGIGQTSRIASSRIHALGRLVKHRAVARTVGKQPMPRPGVAPVHAQRLQEARRKQRVAILGTLCVRETYVAMLP
jgi:hypothetical protein